MEREIEEGGSVWVKLPYGEFVVDNAAPTVLFAGGTGITAFSAFIEALGPTTDQDVYLFYGARTFYLLVYGEVAAQLSRAVDRFHPVFYIESGEGDPMLRFNDWPVKVGRLSVDDAWLFLPNPLAMNYYLSGPPRMIAALSNDLRSTRPASGTDSDRCMGMNGCIVPIGNLQAKPAIAQ